MLASTKARNASVAYNMRAVGGLMGAGQQLANFKKLRFEHKYKDVPAEQKQALYLEETVNELALTEAEDTERLHKVRQAAAARQFEALQALPKFGVATYANTKETDPDLAEKVIRAWAHVLEGQDGHEALCEARKELDGILESAKCLPPLPPRQGARLCLGISLADEQLVMELGRLERLKLYAAFTDAKDRGSTVDLLGVEDRNMGRFALEAWFDLLMAAADEDARQVLRDAIAAHLTGDRSQPGTPPKISRQLGFKGTPEQPLPPLTLPPMTRTHAVPQTTWAFQEADEEAPEAPVPPPSPAEQTPNAKPAPEAPPEQPRPVLTVNVAAATKPLGAGKNLEAALDAAEDEKKRKRSDSPPKEKKAKTLTNVDHELNEEAGTTCPPPVAA